MLAFLIAVALAAAPATDTIFTADGGRLQGDVVEDSARGVAVQLADGTTRTFPPGEVIRIEYGDGSVSVPKPPPAPPAPEPPKAAAAAPLDTIFLAAGGRARGTVVEETADGAVTVRLLDGTTRRYPPGEVARIAYADGTVSILPPKVAPPPPPLPAALAPIPVHAEVEKGPRSRWYLSVGVGGAGFSGDAESGVRMSQLVTGQFDLYLETGWRVAPSVALALYLDTGFGDAGTGFGAACPAYASDCGGVAVRGGVLVKHTWNPAGAVAPWVALGVGAEAVNAWADGAYGPRLDVTYSGWELPRLMAGLDFRPNREFGLGLYGGVVFDTFTRVRVEDATGAASAAVAGSIFHETFVVGLKVTLFP